MKTGKRIRVCIDMVMILLLPFLMAYSLVGETAHEWMGIGMFFLFILHHVINHACRKYAICLLRAIFGMVSCYGIYAFVHRNISAYLFLKEQFVFFDYSQPTLYFIADYAAMICLFSSVGYFMTRMLQ